MTRKTILRLGAARESIRVFTESDGALCRVQWREHGRLKTKSWPNVPAGRAQAKAFAQGLADRRTAKPEAPRLTMRDIWRAYADDRFQHLRVRSQRIYTEYWMVWQTMWGATAIAEDATRQSIVELRKALDARGLAVTTIGETIRMVKRVYRYAEAAELIARNRVSGYEYRVAKEKRPAPVAEYRTEEIRAILAQLNPASPTQWRPWCALTLCWTQGARQHAVLHLQWADVDLEARRVTWRAEWDKVGRERTQPLREAALEALAHAQAHRERMGYVGPWVFPAGSAKSVRDVYSIQSLWAALTKAERSAKVEHKRQRGGHGLRRLLTGDVNALTGDPMLALHAIGDTDARQAARYIVPREDRIKDAFDGLDRAIADDGEARE